MKKITINKKDYDFISDFKELPQMRHSFNKLAKATFEFDFEDYYHSGYWNERYIPYALVDQGKVVANVSANILTFSVLGQMKCYIQIGTVMTDQAYRNQGLSRFLLSEVIKEWQDKSHMIYLFANDSVLDFYPKFGFQKKMEYQYEKEIFLGGAELMAQKLNMDEQENRVLLFRLSDQTRCFSKLSAMKNTGLVMFYATSFMKDDFYYIKELDTAVFAQYKDNTLYLNDIFCPREISLEQVISMMAVEGTRKVVLGFVPLDTDGYTCKAYFEEDTTLFIRAEGENIFDQHKLMLPILSHA